MPSSPRAPGARRAATRSPRAPSADDITIIFNLPLFDYIYIYIYIHIISNKFNIAI